MKIFFPEGTIKYAHIYQPHVLLEGSPASFMVCPEKEYMAGFADFDEFFAKTPRLRDKPVVKISTRKRPEIDTNSYDLLKRHYDMNIVRNRSTDILFLEHPVIVELDMEPIPKNEFGYSGFVLILKGLKVCFAGVG